MIMLITPERVLNPYNKQHYYLMHTKQNNMSNYSKGAFTHQSLRIDTTTLARLQKLRQDKGIYMAQFASEAINAAIDKYYALSINEVEAKELWKTIFNTEPHEDFGKLV